MTAPLIWIVFPMAVGVLLLLLPRERLVAFLGTLVSVSLAALAVWLPPDTVQRVGPLTLRIESTLNVFGRQIALATSEQIVLVLVYGIGAFWFFGTLAAGS